MKHSAILLAVLLLSAAGLARELEPLPDAAAFSGFEPVKAPAPAGPMLRLGDRLAIIGDSITEQKMYSRIVETYLAACLPELGISVRQYGWGGETAEGFVKRMENDVLRFKPTVATTCYGMNDHRYAAYTEANGAWYRSNQLAIVRAFKSAGARFVLGSPGCVGPKVPWAKGSTLDMNLNLCRLRNIDIEVASAEGVAFADVFWPMLTLGVQATNRFGPAYAIAGKDAVHPGWAGHMVMASAFLHALGVDGDLGVIEVDLGAGTAAAAGGHTVASSAAGEIRLTSRRYPFRAPPGELSDDNAQRSGMALARFDERFNRLRLVARHGAAGAYKVTWGDASKTFDADRLAAGVNLAAEFATTPFDAAFRALDEAVGRKQSYETRQIKALFHGEEGQADMEATVALTEKARAVHVAAVASAMKPVEHVLRIEPLP